MKPLNLTRKRTLSRVIPIGLVTFLLSAYPILATPVEEVESVVSHLVGVMDTSAQAAANPKAAIVRMTTCRIQVTEAEDANSVYLYQEQALSENLDQPYRQRFLEIQPSADGQTVESKSFKPSYPETLIGLCAKPEGDRLFKLSDISESVCSVFLRPSASGFVGETQPEGCPANVRGAVKITNTVILHSSGMDTWDRGFDVNGKQVWGAENESYQYRWLKD